MSVTCDLPPARHPRNLVSFEYLVPCRQIGHQLEHEATAGLKRGGHGGQSGAQVGFAHQRLQDAVGRHHEAEVAIGKRQVADVAPHEAHPTA